jgi:hypothetical protein
MDLAEHELYVKYSMAKDTTFQYTDIKQAPWYVVPSDDKKGCPAQLHQPPAEPVRLRRRRARRGRVAGDEGDAVRPPADG